MEEVFRDAAKTGWAIAKPIVTKILAWLVLLIVAYILIFKLIVPTTGSMVKGFFTKEPTKAELQEKVGEQKATINALKVAVGEADTANKAAIEELKGAATINDVAVGEILIQRNENKVETDSRNEKFQKTMTSIKVDQALANQNTRTLIEKKAAQQALGEDTKVTEKLIEQSRLASRALDKKHATETITTIWESYENAIK